MSKDKGKNDTMTTFIPDDIRMYINSVLEEISRETQAGVSILLKGYSEDIGVSILFIEYKKVSVNPVYNSLSNEINEKMENILHMMETSQKKSYFIILYSCIGVYKFTSEFTHIRIYNCQPEHKHIEGDYVCANKVSQYFGSYAFRTDLGVVYLNGQVVGNVTPRKLYDKL